MSKGKKIEIEIQYPVKDKSYKYLGARFKPELYQKVNQIRESKNLSWTEFLTPWLEKIVEVEKEK